MTAFIDLNADMGEYGDDNARQIEAAVMAYVTSCSIACGGHAGDSNTMRETARLAQRLAVHVGAHPSYPDRDGFGRRRIRISATQLYQSLVEQIQILRAILDDAGITLHHVKPHGALYNDAAADRVLAAIVAAAVTEAAAGAVLVGPPASALHLAAESTGMKFATEGFVDRLYQADGSLTPRAQPGAVIAELETRTAQAIAIARKRAFAAAGGELRLCAQTLCIHSDSPSAAETARAVRHALKADGIVVRAFRMTPIQYEFGIVSFGEFCWLATLKGVDNPIESGLFANMVAQTLLKTANLIDVTPAIDSIAIRFDPAELSPNDARTLLSNALTACSTKPVETPLKKLDIPVLYGPATGYDFDWLCRRLGFTRDALITAHSGTSYRVVTFGFAPGFAYLGPLDKCLQAPRLDEPRQRVPAGSIGVAGGFTGIYSLPSPGGWRIIGRTPLPLFDKDAPDPFRLTPGAQIRFVPITESEFEPLDMGAQ